MGKQERQKVILPQMASSVIGLLMSLSRKGKGAACMAVGETATARMAVSRIWGRGGSPSGVGPALHSHSYEEDNSVSRRTGKPKVDTRTKVS